MSKPIDFLFYGNADMQKEFTRYVSLFTYCVYCNISICCSVFSKGSWCCQCNGQQFYRGEALEVIKDSEFTQ